MTKQIFNFSLNLQMSIHFSFLFSILIPTSLLGVRNEIHIPHSQILVSTQISFPFPFLIFKINKLMNLIPSFPAN